MNLIELQGVRKYYRQGGLLGAKNKVEVLNGVDLVVRPGQCLGLLGASGCGKSTAGRLALGLEKPDAGGVFYKGRDLKELSGEEWKNFRRNSQVVFQNSHGAVNPRHRAWRIVTESLSNFSAMNHNDLRDQAVGLLQRVGLSAADLDKLPHQFSGGELQRVCVARALALKPEFILLDEAVSSLDMLSQSRVLDLLAELKAETGAAFLFISHDLRVLLKISDSLVIMDQGRITSHVEDMAELERAGAVYDPAFVKLAGAVLPAEPVHHA